ncbi:MAG: methyltransferase domain-containing protein [Anaerolineae bacterium]
MILHLSDKAIENIIFRRDRIVEICKEKIVLHLGFVQHEEYEKRIREDTWLHSKIVDVAKRVVGVDYLPKLVEQIRMSSGYEVYVGDVMRLTDLPINETFDVIVCGELIEHIENPGVMLEGIKRFCHQHTLVVFTTPNPWARHRIRLIYKGILEQEWLNSEHVMWFSFQTLKQLLDRKGYRCITNDYYYAQTRGDLLENTSGLLGQLRLLRRIVRLKRTPKWQFDGLFFVASPVDVLQTNA